MFGAHVGYKGFNNWNVFVPARPAAELEAYYIGLAELKGRATNVTDRLPEHIFSDKFPLRTGVFLANLVLENKTMCKKLFPYLGFGAGPAFSSISSARSLQISPIEEGVEHFNTSRSDKTVGMAAQVKLGVRYKLNPKVKAFAEYRYLYLSQTQYTFGSTAYPGHPVTSPWTVKVMPQHYNMGIVGLDFSF